MESASRSKEAGAYRDARKQLREGRRVGLRTEREGKKGAELRGASQMLQQAREEDTVAMLRREVRKDRSTDSSHAFQCTCTSRRADGDAGNRASERLVFASQPSAKVVVS